MPSLTTGRALAAISCLLLAGCGSGSSSRIGGDSDPTARLAIVETLDVQVTVVKYGAPVPGARITLTDVHRAPDPHDVAPRSRARVYFRGGTDTDGLCDVLAAVPTSVGRVDVIVHHPGSVGPYSDESLRAEWGVFAPSSRVTLGRSELGAVTVELEDRP